MHAHFSRAVGQHRVPVFQFHLEHGIGQRLDHGPFQDNRVFLGLWQSEVSSGIENRPPGKSQTEISAVRDKAAQGKAKY